MTLTIQLTTSPYGGILSNLRPRCGKHYNGGSFSWGPLFIAIQWRHA